ncbi:TPA: hypothetical protein DD449_04395 [Candidatus Berkelbacteria bacterium]|uniref:Uncharacterized protein n=1 Tax=Berkelbacteria bacterium GW2011_GWE1_39_12 TaxID=1618337 RepID=A0A0G4B388_9BACT|nr:MAG: hypothetical protein UT28_C0001G0499 [Berkelbacteria bacterium GW2011_GWE1_39_12]HBO60895.1 hypothetical protein [Candidatus Berkelbacteria bacterium]
MKVNQEALLKDIKTISPDAEKVYRKHQQTVSSLFPNITVGTLMVSLVVAQSLTIAHLVSAAVAFTIVGTGGILSIFSIFWTSKLERRIINDYFLMRKQISPDEKEAVIAYLESKFFNSDCPPEQMEYDPSVRLLVSLVRVLG